MGAFDWLFGKIEEDKPPETLVFGAELKCPLSKTTSHLLIKNVFLDINNLPEATVIDSIKGDNITPFGQCLAGGLCDFKMELSEKWENLEVQNKLINGEEIITTKSILMCVTSGEVLEILNSGQNGEFAQIMLLFGEMELQYPGLTQQLFDPYGSVYLESGMRDIAMQFLRDKMRERGGEIDISQLNIWSNTFNQNVFSGKTATDIENLLIFSTYEKLISKFHTFNPYSSPGDFFGNMWILFEGYSAAYDDTNAMLLDNRLLQFLESYSQDWQTGVDKGGSHLHAEKNKEISAYYNAAGHRILYSLIIYKAYTNQQSRLRTEPPKKIYGDPKNEFSPTQTDRGIPSDGKTYPNIYPEDTPISVRAEQPKYNGEKYVNSRGYTMRGTYEYVILEDGRIRIGTANTGHTHLANGKPVIYAGEMTFTNGQFQSWNNRSGHYVPDASGASSALPYINDGGILDANLSNFSPR